MEGFDSRKEVKGLCPLIWEDAYVRKDVERESVDLHVEGPLIKEKLLKELRIAWPCLVDAQRNGDGMLSNPPLARAELLKRAPQSAGFGDEGAEGRVGEDRVLEGGRERDLAVAVDPYREISKVSKEGD